MEIQSYGLVQSDHPQQHKRGGVYIYFRNSLFILGILNINYLQESRSFELSFGSKLCKSVSHYGSPSQTSDDGFEKFTDNLELSLDTLAEYNQH